MRFRRMASRNFTSDMFGLQRARPPSLVRSLLSLTQHTHFLFDRCWNGCSGLPRRACHLKDSPAIIVSTFEQFSAMASSSERSWNHQPAPASHSVSYSLPIHLVAIYPTFTCRFVRPSVRLSVCPSVYRGISLSIS